MTRRALIAALTAALVLTGCEHPPTPFRTCTEASAANAAPLRADHPRYNPQLDRDKDGTACDTP